MNIPRLSESDLHPHLKARMELRSRMGGFVLRRERSHRVL